MLIILLSAVAIFFCSSLLFPVDYCPFSAGILYLNTKSCSSQHTQALLRAMESSGHCLRLLNSVVCISTLATILFTHCDARIMVHSRKHHGSKLQIANRVKSNIDPYTINSPFYLPPFDSLSPLPQPDQSPPSPTSYGLPTPPPPGSTYIHSPPANSIDPSPPEHGFSPPGFFPSAPQHQPSPLKHVPSPTKHVPGQPIYERPVLNPPPPHKGSRSGVWCVAKPTVANSIIQAAMDYACGSGADCKSIQPNEACFQPNTLMAHASYAFNSYWQNAKRCGGTCDFGGAAMLVTVDPSFGKCLFSYIRLPKTEIAT